MVGMKTVCRWEVDVCVKGLYNFEAVVRVGLIWLYCSRRLLVEEKDKGGANDCLYTCVSHANFYTFFSMWKLQPLKWTVHFWTAGYMRWKALMEHVQFSNLLNAALSWEQQFSIRILEPLTREKWLCKPAIQAENTLSRHAHSHIILTAPFKHHVGNCIICVHTRRNPMGAN